jgi:cell division protein ZapA
MSQVTIEVNGRPYVVGCEDGQEGHLIELARHFDQQVSQVSQQVGQLGESRLFLMGALMLADELADARSRLAEAQGEAARQQAEARRIEARAANVIEMATRKIEALAVSPET